VTTVAQGICATEVQKGAPQKRYFLVVQMWNHSFNLTISISTLDQYSKHIRHNVKQH
jgi:16S rRNA G527 N7-methylase RsmG